MSTNWALASNGGVASGTNASSAGPGGNFDKFWVNNGGSPLYDGTVTHCYVAHAPDTIVVTFDAVHSVDNVIVWFYDFDGRATDPGDFDTAATYYPINFTIDTWDGASWVTQATVTGNNNLKRSFSFGPVSTSKVRLNVTSDSIGAWLTQEIQAFGTDVPIGSASGLGTAQAVGFADVIKGAGAAAGSATTAAIGLPFQVNGVGAAAGTASASARGNSTGVFPPVTWNSADKHANITLSDGGKKAAGTGASYAVRATKFRNSGRYYFEIDVTGSNASAGLAAASFPFNALDYIGSAGAVGVRWSSAGFAEYAAPSGAGSATYSGQTFSTTTYYRFAIDFEAARMWIGDANGWRGSTSAYNGNPATGANPTFNDQAYIGQESVAPAFAASASGVASTGLLRAAWPFLRLTPPAGFLPWDDYLDAAIAIGSAAGVAVAAAASQRAVAAASGIAAAAGVSSSLVAIVGVAAGASSATAFEELGVAVAAGSALVAGAASSATTSSAGIASAAAEGVRAKVGAGAAAGSATVYGQAYAREINATSTATASHSGTTYTRSGGVSFLKDGFTLFTGGVDGSAASAHLGDYDSDGALTATMTWTTNQTINGIELYSSAWCDARYIGASPDGTEVFPANVGGAVQIQIQYDTTGTGVFANVLPVITDNALIRRTVIFPSWLSTKAIRVIATSDSSYIRLQELKVFTPVIVTVLELEDFAAATDAVIAVHTLAFESTAAETDTLSGRRAANLVSTAAEVSTLLGIETEQAVGEAAGSSSAAARALLQEVLESSGAAADTLTFARVLTLHSDGVLSTLAAGVLVHAEESTGAAEDTLDGDGSVTQSEESTGVATDTVIGIRRVTVIEESGGIGTNTPAPKKTSALSLASAGAASSSAIQVTLQSVELESTGHAENDIQMPFQGSYPVLWVNSMSAGAATWDGLPFNSFIEADGVVYAAGPSGLFELDEALDDLDVEVPTEIEWDLADRGSLHLQRMRSLYVNAKTASPFTVRVANEQGIFDYQTDPADSDTMTNHRAAIGRGLVSRFTRLSLLHTKAYTAKSAGVGVLESTRRI